jgi:cysteine desulfurase
MPEVRKLRDYFWNRLYDSFGSRVVLNGHPAERLPNTLNVSFVDRQGLKVLSGLDGVAASTGSACHSGAVEISPVLRAMGVKPIVAMGAIRFSLGRSTTKEEIDSVAERLIHFGDSHQNLEISQ